MHATLRTPKLSTRRLANDLRDIFTTRRDGTTWAKADHTLAVAPRYIEALVLPGKHKTLRGIGTRMDLPEDRVRRFISRSPWDHGALQDHLNQNIPDAVRSKSSMLVVDDVGLLKQGKHSPGVQRQYTGAAGKITNCQAAVDLILAVPGKKRNADQVTWPLGMELYVPQKWLEDPAYEQRRRRAAIPEDLAFRKKAEIALDMIARARDHGVEHACIGADTDYGDRGQFRAQLRKWNEPYVVAVTPSQLRVIPEDTPLIQPGTGPGSGRKRVRHAAGVTAKSPAQLAEQIDAWTTIAWSEGTKDALSAPFHVSRIRVVNDATNRYVSDETGWLILERRSDQDLRAFLAWGVDDWPPDRLVEYAHLRWTIEQFHREAKQELGLDHFEGRTWKGWHHHVSAVLLAYALLAELRVEQHGSPGPLPAFPQVVRAVVHEVATQSAMEEGLDRQTAKRIASAMVRKLTDWGKPPK